MRTKVSGLQDEKDLLHNKVHIVDTTVLNTYKGLRWYIFYDFCNSGERPCSSADGRFV